MIISVLRSSITGHEMHAASLPSHRSGCMPALFVPCSCVFALLRLLQDTNQPHNAFFCRADRGVVRLCVWPRRAEWDNAKHTKSFNCAVAELAGFLICNNATDFESFSDEKIAAELASVSLSEEDFSRLSTRFLEHLESK